MGRRRQRKRMLNWPCKGNGVSRWADREPNTYLSLFVGQARTYQCAICIGHMSPYQCSKCMKWLIERRMVYFYRGRGAPGARLRTYSAGHPVMVVRCTTVTKVTSCIYRCRYVNIRYTKVPFVLYNTLCIAKRTHKLQQ